MSSGSPKGSLKAWSYRLNHSAFMFLSMETCWSKLGTLAMKVSRVLEDSLKPMLSWSDILQPTN